MSTPESNHDDAFGKRVAALLNNGLDELDSDISERLRFGRQQAMQKHATQLEVFLAPTVLARAGVPGTLGKGPGGNRAISS